MASGTRTYVGSGVDAPPKLAKSSSVTKVIGANRGDPFAIVKAPPAPGELRLGQLSVEYGPPLTWEQLKAGEPARTTVAAYERLKRFLAWCAERKHTELEFVMATVFWHTVESDSTLTVHGELTSITSELTVALEPNVCPCHVTPDIEHWSLWYHPKCAAATAGLDPGVCHALLRHFLPSLVPEDELVAFQARPQFRSRLCPNADIGTQMAHVHVFLRPRSEGTTSALTNLRLERRLRSPWAEAERLGGRASEVGF